MSYAMLRQLSSNGANGDCLFSSIELVVQMFHRILGSIPSVVIIARRAISAFLFSIIQCVILSLSKLI